MSWLPSSERRCHRIFSERSACEMAMEVAVITFASFSLRRIAWGRRHEGDIELSIEVGQKKKAGIQMNRMHGIASVQVAALLGSERFFGSNLVDDAGGIAEEKRPAELSFAESEEKRRRKEPIYINIYIEIAILCDKPVRSRATP